MAVERDGYRKPDPVLFGTFARDWLDTYPEARQHRRTTRADYRAMVENHFVPYFRDSRVADVTTADIDAYVAAKRRAGLGARTLNIHVTRLGSIFDTARRQGLIPMKSGLGCGAAAGGEEPLDDPLSPVEIQSVMRTLMN